MGTFLRCLPFIGSFFLGCLTVASFFTEPKDISNEILRGIIRFSHDFRPYLMLATLLIILMGQITNEFVEKRKLKREAILAILDTCHSEYYGRVPENERFNHR